MVMHKKTKFKENIIRDGFVVCMKDFTKKEVQFWPFIILAHIVSIALMLVKPP